MYHSMTLQRLSEHPGNSKVRLVKKHKKRKEITLFAFTFANEQCAAALGVYARPKFSSARVVDDETPRATGTCRRWLRNNCLKTNRVANYTEEGPRPVWDGNAYTGPVSREDAR